MKVLALPILILFSLTLFSQSSSSIWGDTSKPESYVEVVPFDAYRAEIIGNKPMPFDVPVKLIGKVDKSVRKIEVFYVSAKDVETDGIYYMDIDKQDKPIAVDSLFEANKRIVSLNTKNVRKTIARKTEVKNDKVLYDDFSKWNYESAITFPIKEKDSSSFSLYIKPLKANESYVMLIRFGYEISSDKIQNTILKLLDKEAVVPDSWFPYELEQEAILNGRDMDSLSNGEIKELNNKLDKKFNKFKNDLIDSTVKNYFMLIGDGDFKKLALKEIQLELKKDGVVMGDGDLKHLTEVIDNFFSKLNGSPMNNYASLLVDFKLTMGDLDWDMSQTILDDLDLQRYAFLADSDQNLYAQLVGLKKQFSRTSSSWDTYYPSIFVPFKDNIYYPENFTPSIGDTIMKICMKGIASIREVTRSNTQRNFLSTSELNHFTMRDLQLKKQLTAILAELDKNPLNDTLERKRDALNDQILELGVTKAETQQERRTSFGTKIIQRLVELEDQLHHIHALIKNKLIALYKRKSKYWQESLKESINATYSGLSVIPIEAQSHTTGNYITRAPYYISADFGFTGLFFKDANDESISSIQPYLGVNFNLFPINKNAPYNLFSRSFERKACNYWRNLLRGTSVVVGLSINTQNILKGGNSTEPSIVGTYNDNNYLISGLGIRLNDFVRLSGGVVWYRYQYSNLPGVTTNYRLSVGPFVSLSLDWDVRSFTGKLGQTINQIFK